MHQPGVYRPDIRFESLAESAPDAIITIDADSTILSANAATERIFGYEPGELIGQSLLMLIPERLRASHEAGIARYLATGRRNLTWNGAQLPGLTRDGREIPLEISFGEFTEESGRHVFSGFVRDISDRVDAERALEAARAEADRALRELTMLSRITDVALAQVTYDEMLDALLKRIREELEVDEATVLLLDVDRQRLAVHATDGILTEAERRGIPMGRGIAGTVAATREPLVLEDISRHEVVRQALRERLTSLAAVPIWSDGDVIGVLHVGSRERRSFTSGDVHLLGIVAERMAGVFARTRLYESERRARAEAEAARRALADTEQELRRLNAELEEHAREERLLRTIAQAISGPIAAGEAMQRIAEGALSLGGAMGVYVEQVVSPGGEVEVVAAAGDGTPTVGQRVRWPGSLTEEMIARREPIVLDRMRGIGAATAPYLADACRDCSALVVPFLGEDRVLGALVLVRHPGDPPFPLGLVNRVRTLGDLASLSLQRLLALAESERRRTEAEAAVRSRDEVLSIVSHDLRNPVSTIAMSASLLLEPDIALGETQRRAQFEVISRSAHRANRLIQDLLDVARIEGGRLRLRCHCEDPAALLGEAHQAFAPMAAENEQTLECVVDGTLPRVHVDRDRVLQVLSNYLHNALKFTPKQGRIVLRAGVGDDDGVVFAVRDTGQGMDPEELSQIFNRFWQSRRTAHLGSGLGLAIARGIAEAHHGRVWAESTPGEGSTFYFALPPSPECS